MRVEWPENKVPSHVISSFVAADPLEAEEMQEAAVLDDCDLHILNIGGDRKLAAFYIRASGHYAVLGRYENTSERLHLLRDPCTVRLATELKDGQSHFEHSIAFDDIEHACDLVCFMQKDDITLQNEYFAMINARTVTGP